MRVWVGINLKMTFKFDRSIDNHPQKESPALKPSMRQQPDIEMNQLQRDRFELLSAYLDSEVTAAERQQVEIWLETDPGTQRLYGRLMNLRQGLQAMSVSSAPQPVEQTVKQVFARMHNKPKQALVWAGISAVLLGAVSGVLPFRQSAVNQIASTTPASGSETLTVALNTPVIEIPKAPAASGKYIRHNQSHQQPNNQNFY